MVSTNSVPWCNHNTFFLFSELSTQYMEFQGPWLKRRNPNGFCRQMGASAYSGFQLNSQEATRPRWVWKVIKIVGLHCKPKRWIFCEAIQCHLRICQYRGLMQWRHLLATHGSRNGQLRWWIWSRTGWEPFNSRGHWSTVSEAINPYLDQSTWLRIVVFYFLINFSLRTSFVKLKLLF